MGLKQGLKDLGLATPKPDINQAGPGATAGDWQIGVTPVTSTDSRYDLNQEKDRAERHEEEVREARQLGEKVPDPVGDLLRDTLAHHHPAADPSPADPVISAIQHQIDEKQKPKAQ